ncbi:hypothetical protein [Halocalculus aciditolerans]|uniref:Uncharacterized protein n=1 Tax=Halocalculus aciditolerans TaxID=1383812 RepID=A0A830FFG0_9EURY|nr:hypothetical protein [Halocalculus aciditolerans]GGL47998.1 hypothetical protein GCM10009039_02760 [Halocalculus aciditolerans]
MVSLARVAVVNGLALPVLVVGAVAGLVFVADFPPSLSFLALAFAAAVCIATALSGLNDRWENAEANLYGGASTNWLAENDTAGRFPPVVAKAVVTLTGTFVLALAAAFLPAW